MSMFSAFLGFLVKGLEVATQIVSKNEHCNLPNLSTWHRVPIGATIPAGTPYAYVNQNCVTLRLDGAYVDIDVLREGTYYTKHRVTPPLPTEEGATIVVSSDERPPRILLTRLGGCWVNQYVVEWPVERITTWAPVTLGETVVMR